MDASFEGITTEHRMQLGVGLASEHGSFAEVTIDFG